MKKYKIEAYGAGAEITIGKIPEDLLYELEGLDASEIGEQTSEIFFEHDELEHVNNIYDEGMFRVYELLGNGEEEIIEEGFEIQSFISREAFVSDDEDDGHFPVLIFNSEEKGAFGNWILEIEDEININKLGTMTLETDMGTIVDTLYYDGEEVEFEDDSSTVGKAYYAKVGWFNPEWHDTKEKYMDLVKEHWSEAQE